jgi:poly [ADP-ribose] polymerase
MSVLVKVQWNEGSNEKLVPSPSESDVWQFIGQQLLTIPVPNTLHVEASSGLNVYGTATLDIGQRGTFVKNGIRKPSMFVNNVRNNIFGLYDSDYNPAYLTCISHEADENGKEENKYKFYHLKPKHDGIHATYGRIGSSRGEAYGVRDLQEPYPSYLYWIRYYEKLSKGYIDNTEIYLGDQKSLRAPTAPTNTPDTPPETPEAKIARQLYNQLLAYSKQIVSENLVNTNVRPEQVRVGKSEFRAMCRSKTVKTFNKHLELLMQVSPRKARFIQELFAKSTDDFAEIIDREENLLNAMEVVAAGGVTKVQCKDTFNPKEIEVYIATDTQKEQVMSHLSDRLQSQVKQIYRVIPVKQQKRFNKYLSDHHIKNVKQLWHGSKNCNWLSIILNGLLLNPAAEITGKMFGSGIYFAPTSEKSWNYTSYYGTKWARGDSGTAFMGLYATAYGDPLDTSTAYQYTAKTLEAQNKNCVHAHAGPQLRYDEIIFYSESATVLNYIVEFGR